MPSKNNMWNKTVAFYRLIRGTVCVSVVFSFIVAISISNNATILLSNSHIVVLTLLSLFLLTAAGFALNDYCDIERDLINSPNRPLANNTLSREMAFKIYTSFFILAIITSFLTLNYKVVFLTAVIFFLLLFYSIIGVKKLLKPWFICNTITAILCSSGWLYAWSLGGDINILKYLILLTIFFVFPREILKDISDVKGDKFFNLKTLPCKYGELFAFKISFIFFLIYIAYSWLLFYPAKIFNIYYFYLVPFFFNSILLYCLIKTIKSFNKNKVALLLKLTVGGFFVGVFAVLIG